MIWVLAYIAIGYLIVLWKGDREQRETLGVTVMWPLLLWLIPRALYVKRKRRQRNAARTQASPLE